MEIQDLEASLNHLQNCPAHDLDICYDIIIQRFESQLEEIRTLND